MTPQTNKKSKWTILIYFAADNDLDETAFGVLREIKKAGSTSDLNVVAQLDTRGTGHTLRFRLRDARYTIEEDRIAHEDEGREINTGDPQELVKFIQWGVGEFPAEHYMLVIWGHGQGWELAHDDHSPTRASARTVNQFVYVDEQTSMSVGPHGKVRLYLKSGSQAGGGANLPQALSFTLPKELSEKLAALVRNSSPGRGDGDTGQRRDVLNSRELNEALKTAMGAAPKLDILGMDACMMGTAEVGHHVRDGARYLIASEDTVPLNSWPYARILTTLHKRPDMSPEELSVSIVREYLAHYQHEVKGVTLSAFDLHEDFTDRLSQALEILARELTEQISDPVMRFAIMKARIAAQSFYLKQFVDLYDFCRHLQSAIVDDKIEAMCQSVMDAIHDNNNEGLPSKGTFVMAYGFCGFPMQGARGASIYFPWNRPRKDYYELPLVRKSGWFDFLMKFTEGPSTAGERPANGKSPLKVITEGDDSDSGCIGLHNNIKIQCGTTEKIPLPHSLRIPTLGRNHPDAERENPPSHETD